MIWRSEGHVDHDNHYSLSYSAESMGDRLLHHADSKDRATPNPLNEAMTKDDQGDKRSRRRFGDISGMGPPVKISISWR